MSTFMDRAFECSHERYFPNYGASGRCSTPYCHGWDECHCQDCGAYVTSCGCGCCNEVNGWPHKRRRDLERRKAA